MENYLDTMNASIAKYIMGIEAGVSIKGSQEKVNAFCDIARKSRALYEALNSDNTSLDEVLALIQEKKESSRRYKDVTGLPWQL